MAHHTDVQENQYEIPIYRTGSPPKLPPRTLSPKPKSTQKKPSDQQEKILSKPEYRKVDLINAVKQEPPGKHGKAPASLKLRVEIPHLSSVPVGTPHWQEHLRNHLFLSNDEKIVTSTKPEADPTLESISSEMLNKANVDLETCDGNTDLDRLVFSRSVPRMVIVKEKYSTPGCSIVLDKDDILMLHYPITQYRVRALDPDSVELWLPIQTKQKFERLPLDPKLDDKIYMGTRALAEAKPLPNCVRVTEAHCTGDPKDATEVDDIVDISHVEWGKTDKGKPQKVVVGKIDDQVVHLGEDVDCAEYSTMLSDEFLPMSELIKLDFPQRVRVVDMEAKRRLAKEETHLKLLSYEKENHIICTQPHNKRVFSIPLTCPIKLLPMSGDWAECRKALPPLYSLVNHTWNVQDLGRRDLPDNFRQIAQPMPEIIKDWIMTDEGKGICVQVADKHIKDMKDTIASLKRHNMQFMFRLPPDKSSKTSSTPPLPIRGQEMPRSQPPARPPKSDSLRQTTRKYNPLRRTSSHDSILNVNSSKKTDGFTSYLPKNIDSSDDSEDYETLEDDGAYETPPQSPAGTIDRKINQIKKIMGKKEGKEVAELKKQLAIKEEVIRNDKIREDHLRQTNELLQKEKEQLEKKNNEHVTQIRNLQIALDQSLDQSSQYDSIVVGPGAAGNMGNEIYNSPIELHGVEAMGLQAVSGVKAMGIEAVSDLLRDVNLGQYVESFEKEQIDGILLEELEEVILKEDLGMSGLHARKLMVEVKRRTNKI